MPDHISNGLALENQLCFALYAATRAVTQLYREKLSPLGLTYPQYLVLLVLWDEAGVTLSHIGRRLKLDSGTLTPLIKRMERGGLVARRRNPNDEREVLIWPSDHAVSLRQQVYDARLHVLCRLGIDEAELAEKRADIMEIVEAMENGQPETGA